MSAQPHLHTVPEIDHSLRRRRQLRAMNPLPLVLAELRAEAEARHRRLVTLESLLHETPIWCVRQRWFIKRAVAACQPPIWS
jgi:hypothetical protein